MPPDRFDQNSADAIRGASSTTRTALRRVGLTIAWVCVSLLAVWAVLALYFDSPFPKVRVPVAVAYALLAPASFIFVRSAGLRLAVCLAGFVIVLLWWLTLKPSNDRPWQADVAQTAWAEVNGDVITIHNYRDCDYRAEFDYSCQWKTKTVRLSELRGIDVSFIHWGIPKVAHMILSFHFAGDDYVAVSIEMRKQIGQTYSSIRGFFRQYELIYIFADERDLLQLRTSFRKGEEVYLFRTTADAAYSRKLFMQYVNRTNEIHAQPEWYNALLSNCTTSVFAEMLAIGPLPAGISRFDPRIVLSGDADEMLYDAGYLSGHVPISELREHAQINAVARAAYKSPDFSRLIRAGRTEFETSPPSPH